MSKRHYDKGAARGYHRAPRGYSETREAIRLTQYDKTREWFLVFKDGKKLSYGHDLAVARKHAANCGGKVFVWRNGEHIDVTTKYTPKP